MTEISATKDSVAQQAGRDSVVNFDDRVIYTNCPIVINVHHQNRGVLLLATLPCLILLFFCVIYFAPHPTPTVTDTLIEIDSHSGLTDIQRLMTDV